MPRFGKFSVAVAALALLWAGFAYTVTRPDDRTAYRRTVRQVAEAAHDATRSGWLTGRQELAGRAFGTFATAAFDDATKALGGADKQFAQASPPDAASRRLRDELNPLLTDARVHLADAAAAEDNAALRAATDALGQVADKLDSFVEDLQ